MSIHIKTGNGSPTINNIAGTPGCHYIDLDTGDHYLYGTNQWASIGAPAMSVLKQDASVNAGLVLDFNHTDFLLYNAPASGAISLDLSGIDPVINPPTGAANIMVLSATPVEIINSSYGAYVAFHDGITFNANTLTPPSGALGMLLHVKQMGLIPAASGGAISIEASALMSLSTGIN